MSHLGHSYHTQKVSDLILAKKSKHIDLIIGGHTHTFLNKPIEIKNKSYKNVLVTQAGWAGINLGRIDYEIHLKSSDNQAVGSSYKI